MAPPGAWMAVTGLEAPLRGQATVPKTKALLTLKRWQGLRLSKKPREGAGGLKPFRTLIVPSGACGGDRAVFASGDPASQGKNRFLAIPACAAKWRGRKLERVVGGAGSGSSAKGGTQSADKAHNCGNCPDKREIGGNFRCFCSPHLHSAVIYVHIPLPLDASLSPWLSGFLNTLPVAHFVNILSSAKGGTAALKLKI